MFSPYGQKTKSLLAAAGTPFKRCDQPAVLPRRDLEALGITYRRIPVLAIGKDVYCDSSLIFDVILKTENKNSLATSPLDKAWEAWGYDGFLNALLLIPTQILSPDFLKDRSSINFPMIQRDDYAELRPSGIAELQSRMTFVENELLTKGTFMNGDKPSVSDIHMIWGIRWALDDQVGLGAKNDKGVGKDSFPKVWKLIESLPEANPETLSAEDTIKTITGADYTAKELGMMKDDPLGFEAGTPVKIDSVE